MSTSYTPIATGGVGVNPLNSFQLKPVGINVDITPRVTLEGDIIIELNVESSSVGPDKNIAGTNYPSFSSRKVGTKLRLRDGESNLLAGLLREDERRSLTGFPGAIHVPMLKQLFSANDESIAQTDIVMLLTPHVVRSHEISEEDLRPIYIGTQQNLGLGGPPALMGPAPAEAPPSGPAPAQPPAAAAVPGFPQTSMSGAVVTAPPGSSPVPGTVVVPPPQPQHGAGAGSAAGPSAQCSTGRARCLGNATREHAGTSGRVGKRASHRQRARRDDVAGDGPGAGDRHAAWQRPPRWRRSVHCSNLHHERHASIHGDADADL